MTDIFLKVPVALVVLQFLPVAWVTGKFDIILALSGIEDQGGAWIETGAVDNPRQGSRESLSFALGR